MPDAYPDDVQPNLSNENIVLQKMLFYAAGMEAVAEHSLVDAQVSRLLTQMLGANPKPAVAMYETLNGAKAEARALKAVGAETLSLSDNARLGSVMKVCKVSSDLRDTIAHRLWLADARYPDAVVLFDPKSMWRMSFKATAVNAAGPVTTEAARDVQADIRKASQIWRISDFDAAKRAASKAFIALVAFNEALALGDTPDGSAKRALLDAHLSA